MNDQLLRAILSMDAYNRGYNAGIINMGGLGSQIGDAIFSDQSDTESGQAGTDAGFYASVYTLADGTKVISYRGTDDLQPLSLPWSEFGSDMWNGYSTNFGSPESDQAKLGPVARTTKNRRVH